jgi:hypothetical protein
LQVLRSLSRYIRPARLNEEALHARRRSAKVLPRKLSKVGKAVLAILRAPPPKHVFVWMSLSIHAQVYVLLKLTSEAARGTW